MRIERVCLALPSRSLSSEDVIELIKEETERLGSFEGDLPKTLAMIRASLRRSGAKKRHWLAPDESPLDLIRRACRNAMEDIDPATIDLLLWASVDLAVVEPSTASLVAHMIGLDHVKCRDVKQACDGWMGAVEFADALIQTERYRRIMIVNGEFGMVRGGMLYPRLFALKSPEELVWRFPSFTVGEAATATIVGASSDEWKFSNRSRNDLYDLCTVSRPWPGYPITSERIGKDGPGHFTSYGSELRSHGLPLALETFNASGIKTENVDILFTHSSSKKDWRDAAKAVGLENKLYDIYADCGNVVSAAIPAAMARAVEDDSLKRGMRVAAWVASAGMSFSTVSFTY